MNYFTRKKLTILLIAVLLIANIASIGTIIFLSYRKPPMPEPQFNAESFRKTKEKLGFTKEKEDTLKIMQKKYWEQSREVMVQLHQKRVLIMDEFSKPDTDSTKLYLLAEETGDLHTQLKKLTINHMLEMKSVCTEEQFKFLDGMFRKRMMEDERKFRPDFDRKRQYKNRKERRSQREN